MTPQTIATIVLCVVYIPVAALIHLAAIRFNEINHRLKRVEEEIEDISDEWQNDDDDLEDECAICKRNIDDCECE